MTGSTSQLIVGLTGGIGSGKSTICEIFKVLGVPIYQADARAKALMESDPELMAGLQSEFGVDIFQGSKLDRAKLASMVFGDANQQRLAVLNALVHPAVFRDTVAWIQAHAASKYVIKEAAILFESGASKGVHASVVVSCPLEIRIERVMARDRVSRSQVEARMQSQWSDEQRAALADFVIVNDGLQPVLPQVLTLHQNFLSA